MSRSSTTPQPPPQMSDKVRRPSILPAQLGPWSLGNTIGCGSTAKVKRAKHVETGELVFLNSKSISITLTASQVAIKIVPHQKAEQFETCRSVKWNHSVRAVREATLCSLMNHPYISDLRDVACNNDHWFLFFGYCNGGQLLDYIIRWGRLKEKQARKFGRQIVSALDYCHRNNIVHLNLSCQNILVSKSGDIKLIDFCCSSIYSPIFTDLSAQCCSHYYPAPEMIEGQQYVGPEVDVWCLGIILYILVCGKVPFDAQDMSALREKILECHVEYPSWLSLGKSLNCIA
jgi:serine/threonine protein kinase